MTMLLVLVLLTLLWIVGILLRINANFVKWANADIKKRALVSRR